LAALEELKEKGTAHHNAECPKCRHRIKVPRSVLERMQPRQNG
jgi:hypothetical protein